MAPAQFYTVCKDNMKTFDELDEKAQNAIILIHVSPLIKKILSPKQEDIDDLPDEIFNDLTLLINNRHPKSDTKQLTQEVRDRILARVSAAIHKVAKEQVSIMATTYSEHAVFTFPLHNWCTILGNTDPKTFLPKEE